MGQPGLRACFAVWAIVCLAASPPAWAADPAPISLVQDGNWVANYDDESCQLLGKFGTGKLAIVAIFTRYEPTDSFHLSLQGESLELRGNRALVKLAFGTEQTKREELATLGKLAAKPLMVFGPQRFDGWRQPPGRDVQKPPAVTPAQEAAVSHLTLRLGGNRNYRLELRSMGKPMATMRHCMDGLIEHWGYNPTAIAALSRLPTPINDPGKWVTTNDYPSNALRTGHGGIVQFRLDLDEAGKILKCHILSRTNPDEFADTSCRLLTRRARFEPALDAAGKPTKSFYVNSVRFIIPG